MEFDPNNGIKVGDIVTAYHQGFWKVTSIEPRTATDFDVFTESTRFKKVGDVKSSLIHYELFCDENYNLSESGKRKNRCDAFLCKVVDVDFIKKLIDQKLEEIDKLIEMAYRSRIVNFYTEVLKKLSRFQRNFAAEQVGQWLDKSGDERNKTYADAVHSSFLKRLLLGKPALKHAPPCMNSYPCYPLGEGQKIEIYKDGYFIREALNDKTNKTIVFVGNSSPFEWHDKKAGILVYPKTKELFKILDEGDKKYIQKVETNAVT